MTESEWLQCTDPQEMLACLKGKVSDRKLRLFACACYYRVCHLLPHLLPGALAREAVQVAERFAEGMAAVDDLLDDLQEAIARVWEAIEALEERRRATQVGKSIALQPTHEALALAFHVLRSEASEAAYYASSTAYRAAAAIANPGAAPHARAFANSLAAEEKAQSDLLRCIFGHLFRPATIPSTVRTWNNATVVKLAQSIHARQTLDHLPILADALEEAGCDNADILDHLRGPGPHTRGCWALDLLLGRE
jgi:hypothetical protein